MPSTRTSPRRTARPASLDTLGFDHGDRRSPADDAQARTLLLDGELDLEGRLLDASNVTLIGAIRTDTLAGECVYKPVRGERPLWDFPDGTLAGREISAYLVSEATGWRVVPPTVLRDGPFGPAWCSCGSTPTRRWR